ncbi:MAG: GGDEF domain-containing protein [Planctomycetota bacterium]
MVEIYYCGRDEGVAEQISQRLGRPVQREFPTTANPGDLVFLDVRVEDAAAARLPGGNAFSACRTLKQDPKVRVFLLVAPEDRFAPEIGRFCLADGAVELGADGALGDVGAVEACLLAPFDRTPVAELLASLESELKSDEGLRSSMIQNILCLTPIDTLTRQLTDPVTGLFSAPFASFKLEEEFKRAIRFHQPLSLVLIDVGEETLPTEPEASDRCLAEVASVFLNECRDIDILARFTESTFVFLLPGTGSAGAEALVRRILTELANRPFADDARLQPQAGMATVPAAGIDNRREMLARAEAGLRLARADC